MTLCVVLMAGAAQAAISWDGEGNSNWWFDPANWSQDAFGYLPPSQDSGGVLTRTDAQINGGSGPWDVTGEGVVYDPDNDPFFADAASLPYATGSNIAGTVGGDYGPEHIYRLYISRNTTNSNLLTIKSGDLAIESTTIIGRSGSSSAEQNLGAVVQTGGRLNIPATSLDIGNSETSGWGNGRYEYLGGTMDISIDAGNGIRLAHGRNGTGPSGVNWFVIGNGEAGHLRTWDYNTISYHGTDDGLFTEGEDPNGVDRGVAYTEFRLENGGTRPVQVGRNVTLNNGLDIDSGGTFSSRLVLTLEEAPATVEGVPADLGLFDVDFDIGFGSNGGVINGFGDIDNDTQTDAVFAHADGAGHYLEGDTISAMFGATRYDWTITYTGDITWSDADNSVIDTLSGPGSGGDIVLVGLGSEVLGLAGDYNEDGNVDAADYTVWRDGDSPDSSQAGYDLWVANYGSSSAPQAGASAPEPAALLLIASATLAVGSRRRR